jgi:hypothetical protein
MANRIHAPITASEILQTISSAVMTNGSTLSLIGSGDVNRTPPLIIVEISPVETLRDPRGPSQMTALDLVAFGIRTTK